MIAVDTNVLVYSHRKDSPWHDTAQECVKEIAEGKGAWAIPWPCLHEFLAIVTHPRIFEQPTPMRDAVDQVAAWMDSPSLALLSESDGYWAQLYRLVSSSRVRGPQIHDARIAALSLHHGVDRLWTADRDFGRFPDLRTENPLVK